MTGRPNPSRLAYSLQGAAAGAVALAGLAAIEIALRGNAGPPLLAPLSDLSLLARGGALLGALVGLAAASRPLRFLSPFGVALGAGVALWLWLAGVTGSRLAGGAALPEAIRGALFLLAGAALGQLVGSLGSRLPGVRSRRPLPIRDVLVVLVLVLAGPVRGLIGAASDGPNVLLLTIDTLRSDRLGFSGHPLPTSPHLDRLARRSLACRRATTPLPRTLPAVASMMTGLFPHAHGVRDNFHYALGEAPVTLAERLRDAGWATAAVNSNPILSHDSGVYRGFDSANDRGDDWARLGIVRGCRRIGTLLRMRSGDRAQVVTDLAIDWLEARPGGKPFFLWVHWLAPHMPYEPEFPFDRIFDPGNGDGLAGRLDYDRISKGDMTYRNPLTAEEMAGAKALYDGETATADRALGRLLRRLESRGELERTVVLFTSDHGESLDEHGYFLNHGDFVYGPAANVPFLLLEPGASARLEPDVFSIMDVVPEILSRVRPEQTAPAEDDGTRGARYGESGFCRFPHLNEQLGYLLPRDVAQNPDLVADWRAEWEEQANRAKQRYLEEGHFKLVLTPRPDGDVVELFDLERDPAETRDVSPVHPQVAESMREKLLAWIEAGRAYGADATPRTIDDELREQMEGIGYLGD